jgi:hypothetical protein
MTKTYFVADFFANQVPGGGELNNEVLISSMLGLGYDINKINSNNLSLNFVKQNKDAKFIIANFWNLPADSKDFLISNSEYVIYEHDHKYASNRNPAQFKDFIVPDTHLINVDFYKNAKSVFCQSKFHGEIIYKNLKINNICNLGGNLWDEEALSVMKQFSKKDKHDRCSIIHSDIPHKNTFGAIKYCIDKNYDFDLVYKSSHLDFLKQISKNNKFVFFPQSPETLSRIVVESRMMGLKVITNKNVGATSENWFKLKGEELVDFMETKKKDIIDNFESFIK